MRRALAVVVIVNLILACVAPATAQQAGPSKTVGVVLVVPPTGHLSRDGWFVEKSCEFFDLKEMNLYGAVFDAARSVLSPRYGVARVTVTPGAEIRTRNTETFGAFKLFPPVGEQVRQFSRAEAPVDLYLVVGEVCRPIPALYIRTHRSGSASG